MRVIEFTAHHEDLSTDRGYQFKFYCDKCGNGYMSRFEPSVSNTTGGLLRAASGIFGGILPGPGNGGHESQRSVRGRAHYNASERAVEEAKAYFKRCGRCGKWVCPEGCWNTQAGSCEECGPQALER